LSSGLRRLVLVRHAHARSNADDAVSSVPPGAGLTSLGVREALALRDELASEHVDLGVATRLLRTQETLDLALGEREVPRVVLRGLDEIGFGAFEGGPLAVYRDWAWSHPADAICPGRGESRAAAAARFAGALEGLLGRPEKIVLAVSHALPIRYVLDAANGSVPGSRVETVRRAMPHALDAAAVRVAAETLRAWAAAPRFAERGAPGAE
jgi:probable phosphoglycerate mutase